MNEPIHKPQTHLGAGRIQQVFSLACAAKLPLFDWLPKNRDPRVHESIGFLDRLIEQLTRPDVAAEGTVCRCGEAYLTLIRWDVDQNQESWSWYAVLAVQGELPSEDETAWDEQAILASMREGFGIHCESEGGSGAGRPFANCPWIQFLGTPVRTLIVSQRGGLDV